MLSFKNNGKLERYAYGNDIKHNLVVQTLLHAILSMILPISSLEQAKNEMNLEKNKASEMNLDLNF